MLHNQKKALRSDNKLYFSIGSSKSVAASESNIESNKLIVQFESSKEIQVQNDSRATAILETETQFTKDSRAIREKALKRAEEALKGGKHKLWRREIVYRNAWLCISFKIDLSSCFFPSDQNRMY